MEKEAYFFLLSEQLIIFYISKHSTFFSSLIKIYYIIVKCFSPFVLVNPMTKKAPRNSKEKVVNAAYKHFLLFPTLFGRQCHHLRYIMN